MFPFFKAKAPSSSGSYDYAAALTRVNDLKDNIDIARAKLGSASRILSEAPITTKAMLDSLTDASLALNTKLTTYANLLKKLSDLIQIKISQSWVSVHTITTLTEEFQMLGHESKSELKAAWEVLEELAKRATWHSTDLPDFDFNEALLCLSRPRTIRNTANFPQYSAFINELVNELEGWPSLYHINRLLKKIEGFPDELKKDLSDIHALILNLRNHLKLHSNYYSEEEIADSIALQHGIIDVGLAEREALEKADIIDSSGAYQLSPSDEDITTGLAVYQRNNRPTLQLWDETDETNTRLCLERSAQEKHVLAEEDFIAMLKEFCDHDLTLFRFMATNLGIEPFSMSTCEVQQRFTLPKKYQNLFNTDKYRISWRKLKDPDGSIYYRHELISHCLALKGKTGESYFLPESVLAEASDRLLRLDAVSYDELQLDNDRLAPLLSTTLVIEIRPQPVAGDGSTPRLKLSIVDYQTTTLTTEIKPKAASPTHSIGSGSSPSNSSHDF